MNAQQWLAYGKEMGVVDDLPVVNSWSEAAREAAKLSHQAMAKSQAAGGHEGPIHARAASTAMKASDVGSHKDAAAAHDRAANYHGQQANSTAGAAKTYHQGAMWAHQEAADAHRAAGRQTHNAWGTGTTADAPAQGNTGGRPTGTKCPQCGGRMVYGLTGDDDGYGECEDCQYVEPHVEGTPESTHNTWSDAARLAAKAHQATGGIRGINFGVTQQKARQAASSGNYQAAAAAHGELAQHHLRAAQGATQHQQGQHYDAADAHQKAATAYGQMSSTHNAWSEAARQAAEEARQRTLKASSASDMHPGHTAGAAKAWTLSMKTRQAGGPKKTAERHYDAAMQHFKVGEEHQAAGHDAAAKAHFAAGSQHFNTARMLTVPARNAWGDGTMADAPRDGTMADAPRDGSGARCPHCGGLMVQGFGCEDANQKECQDCGWLEGTGKSTQNLRHPDNGQFVGSHAGRAADRGYHDRGNWGDNGDTDDTKGEDHAVLRDPSGDVAGPDGRQTAEVIPTGQHGVDADHPDDHTWDAIMEGNEAQKHYGAEEPPRSKIAVLLGNKHLGFDKLEGQLERKGDVDDPAAVAAAIGRKKYGAAGMARKAAKGRKAAHNAFPPQQQHPQQGHQPAPPKQPAQPPQEPPQGKGPPPPQQGKAPPAPPMPPQGKGGQPPSPPQGGQQQPPQGQQPPGQPPTGPAPSQADATKAASIASIQTGSPDAMAKAKEAHEAAQQGQDPKEGHEAAAEQHEQEADQVRQTNPQQAQQHDNAAALHRKAAGIGELMKGTQNMLTEHARSLELQAQIHEDAARKHANMRSNPDQRHNLIFHSSHGEDMAETLNLSQIPPTEDSMTANRNEMLEVLTANAACEQDVQVLNTMSTEGLRRLYQVQAEGRNQVTNAKTQGSNSDETGPYDFDSAVQSGGEEEQKPEGKDQGAGQGRNDEDYNERSEKQIKAFQNGEKLAKGHDQSVTGNRALAANAFELAVDRRVQELFGGQDPRVVANMAAKYKKWETQQKLDLVQSMVGGIGDRNQRNLVGNQLMQKSYEELQMLSSLPAFNQAASQLQIPHYAMPMQAPLAPTYLGQAPAFSGTPTSNAWGEVEDLPLPGATIKMTRNGGDDYDMDDDDGDDDDDDGDGNNRQPARNRRQRQRRQA